MSSFTLDVTELQQYADVLREATDASGFQGTVNKYAHEAVRHAKRIVPVRTGHLRDSIGFRSTEASKQGVDASIVADALYAGFVEFGTSRMAPRPYMRPALAAVRRPLMEELVDDAKQRLGMLKKTTRPLLGSVPTFSLEQQLAAGQFQP